MSNINFFGEMYRCTTCGLRKRCTQVVLPTGNTENPILLIIGESPGKEEDEIGLPFVGLSGKLLRNILRDTKNINKLNTCITNTIKCRPPGNKFPIKEIPEICTSKWLYEEIKIFNPKLLLILGNIPLKWVARLEGITYCRGKWIESMGIRTMPTFHPSYVLRKDNEGDLEARRLFTQDIFEVSNEMKKFI